MNSLTVTDNELMIAQDGPMSLPAHLQGIDVGVSKALLAGMYTGGNRIGLKGSRFRLVVAGIEEGVFEENYLDTIFLSAAPAVSRVFYKEAYKQGTNAAPVCYSPDGIAPPLDVPQRQSDKCATCPQNVKGSKIQDGNKYKACGYFRRVVVMLGGDTIERRVYKLDVKAQGLFGENTANAKNLNDYIKSLETRGMDVGHVITRISFDTNSSVPKLLFKPFRYITPDELEAVRALVVSDEVKNMSEVSMTTLDLSHEESADTGAVQEAAQEAPQAAPVQAAPVQQPAPVAAPRPAPVAQSVQRPTPVATRPAVQVETVPVQQTVQRPAPVQQAVQRPVATTAAVQPAPVQQPAAVEVNSNDELANILEGLE